MKLRFWTVTTLTCMAIHLSAQVSFGEPVKINDDWQFKNKDYSDEFNSKPDNENWRIVNLPHDWSVEGPHSPDLASCTGYLPGGIGWYKKTLSIPAEDKGKLIYIYFGGVYCNSEVWVNNHLLGKRPNGYVSFMYDMTPYLKIGGENTILVKVDHSKSADSRWYTGSGIYRDVYLIKANPVHIDQWGVSCSAANISSKQATLNIKTAVKNSTAAQATVTVLQKVTQKGDSKVIATVQKVITVQPNSVGNATIELKVNSPRIWSLNNPNLYEVHTSVIQNKKEIDSNTLQTGIRSIVFDPNKGFSLNGVSMKLKGVCLHHDAGVLGSAVPKQVWEKRLRTLKEMGCNAIRTSHNPQDEVFYDICDEIGLMVMDEAFDEWEFPKRKWIEGWNAGKPGYDGYATYFNEWGEKDITDMVMKHKNQPSIIMWSIGNEVDYPNDPYSHPILDKEGIGQKSVAGYKPNQPDAARLGVIAKKLVACVKSVDTTRPVTGALAGVVMSNHTDYPFALDITGYNYTENRYKQDHEQYPKRVIYGSENRHDLNAWEYVKNNDYVAGQFLWTGIDYLGEAGQWPSRGFTTGLLDLCGNKKSLAWYRESLWSKKPMVYIGTATGNRRNSLNNLSANWNYKPDETITVGCFTNCEKVILKLNGDIISNEPTTDPETGGKSWKVPYKAGILSVTGLNQNKEVATYELRTSEQPEVIECKSEVQTLKGKDDVALIELTITDKNGVPVYLSDNEITCRISGPARILGLENGDMSDMVDHRKNILRVYHGRLMAYIQATGNNGKVDIQFTSNWLKPANISFEIKK